MLFCEDLMLGAAAVILGPWGESHGSHRMPIQSPDIAELFKQPGSLLVRIFLEWEEKSDTVIEATFGLFFS